MRDTPRLVLWGVPPFLTLPVKITAGVFRDVLPAAVSRAREGWSAVLALPPGVHPDAVRLCEDCRNVWDHGQPPPGLYPVCRDCCDTAGASVVYRIGGVQVGEVGP